MRGQFESIDSTCSTGVKYRVCRFCGENKPLDAYAKNGTDENGVEVKRLDCKTCYNIRRSTNAKKKVHSDFVGGQKRRGDARVDFTHQNWKECLIFFGGECAYCGATTRRNFALTKDHLVPMCDGGTTVPSNIVPACGCCNKSKGNKEVKDWYMQQAFFNQERLNKIFKWRTIMRQCEE